MAEGHGFDSQVWNNTKHLKMKNESTAFALQTAQYAKKVVSDSPGLVDFAIRLVNSLFNLPNRQVMFFEEFE